MSSSEISFASLASRHAPALPVVVFTRPALDSFAKVRRTKLGLRLDAGQKAHVQDWLGERG